MAAEPVDGPRPIPGTARGNSCRVDRSLVHVPRAPKVSCARAGLTLTKHPPASTSTPTHVLLRRVINDYSSEMRSNPTQRQLPLRNRKYAFTGVCHET